MADQSVRMTAGVQRVAAATTALASATQEATAATRSLRQEIAALNEAHEKRIELQRELRRMERERYYTQTVADVRATRAYRERAAELISVDTEIAMRRENVINLREQMREDYEREQEKIRRRKRGEYYRMAQQGEFDPFAVAAVDASGTHDPKLAALKDRLRANRLRREQERAEEEILREMRKREIAEVIPRLDWSAGVDLGDVRKKADLTEFEISDPFSDARREYERQQRRKQQEEEAKEEARRQEALTAIMDRRTAAIEKTNRAQVNMWSSMHQLRHAHASLTGELDNAIVRYQRLSKEYEALKAAEPMEGYIPGSTAALRLERVHAGMEEARATILRTGGTLDQIAPILARRELLAMARGATSAFVGAAGFGPLGGIAGAMLSGATWPLAVGLLAGAGLNYANQAGERFIEGQRGMVRLGLAQRVPGIDVLNEARRATRIAGGVFMPEEVRQAMAISARISGTTDIGDYVRLALLTGQSPAETVEQVQRLEVLGGMRGLSGRLYAAYLASRPPTSPRITIPAEYRTLRPQLQALDPTAMTNFRDQWLVRHYNAALRAGQLGNAEAYAKQLRDRGVDVPGLPRFGDEIESRLVTPERVIGGEPTGRMFSAFLGAVGVAAGADRSIIMRPDLPFLSAQIASLAGQATPFAGGNVATAYDIAGRMSNLLGQTIGGPIRGDLIDEARFAAMAEIAQDPEARKAIRQATGGLLDPGTMFGLMGAVAGGSRIGGVRIGDTTVAERMLRATRDYLGSDLFAMQLATVRNIDFADAAFVAQVAERGFTEAMREMPGMTEEAGRAAIEAASRAVLGGEPQIGPLSRALEEALSREKLDATMVPVTDAINSGFALLNNTLAKWLDSEVQ